MKAPPFRVWIGVILFFATFTNYMLRSNMSVSIIRMIKKSNSTKIAPCIRDSKKNHTEKKSGNKITEEKFNWSGREEGNILAGYFYGYQAAMLLGGFFADFIGPWHTIFWSGLASFLLTGLTPLCTKAGVIGVVVVRAFIGFFGGSVFPSCHTLVANWAPPKEKGKFLAAMMGNTVGTATTLVFVGFVTDIWGWVWGFYVSAIIMGLFLIFFFFVVSDKPSKCKWISQEEQEYIMQAQEGHLTKKKAFPPYLSMIKSFRFWISVITQFGNAWNLNLNLTYAPKFLSETVGFNLKASGGLSALPYLARMAGAVIFGICADMLRKRTNLSVTWIRKFFIIFSHLIPAVCLFIMATGGCNVYIVVSMLILNQGFNGACAVSILINAQDLTPNFAGSCFGLMNFIAMLSGSIVPNITGALSDYYNKEVMASTIIFLIGGGVLTVTGLAFILFGTAEIQPWNEVKIKEQTQESSDK